MPLHPGAPERSIALHRARTDRDAQRRMDATSFDTARFSIRLVAHDNGAPITSGDIRAAQRLRHQVFASERGARLGRDGIDEDIHDPYCDHLMVRERATHRVVGTCRILAPEAAERLGHDADSEFFTTRLDPLKPVMAELGRSCIHPDHRTGPVMMLLWAGLARYMTHCGYEHVAGSASVSLADGGHDAARLAAHLVGRHDAGPALKVFPRRALPPVEGTPSRAFAIPPLIQGSLRVGARVCGEPAWDPDFNTAHFFMLLSIAAMKPRCARHFDVVGAAVPERRHAA